MMSMKRVMCLYRVSTKGQVDKQDDIPMQRRECIEFIDRMDDWVFVGERMEKGVSGYKVSAANRDAIIEIREMAEKKKFDVLLVFMFDRLGRKEDETLFLVKWFIEHGIEVWSTREGEQKLDNQVDRLLNFMRYWAASGESEKTSIIDEFVEVDKDIYQHPRTTMDENVEFLTTRPMRVKLLYEL